MPDPEGQQPPDLPQRRAVYLTLMGIFAGAFAAFSTREHKGGSTMRLSAMDPGDARPGDVPHRPRDRL